MTKYIILWIVVFCVIEAIGLFVYIESTGFKISKFVVKVNKPLPRDINIVMLSDLHDTDLGNDNDSLIKAIDDINPDFILLAGDMITSYMQPKYNSDITFSFLDKISRKYEVYYGLGNHEQRYLSEPEKFEGKFDALREYVESIGIKFLMNQHQDIPEYNCRIYGLNIPIEYYRRVVTKELPEEYASDMLGNIDESKVNILLAHNPEQFDILSKWGADIICSGHVHGGIIRIPGLGGLISPQLKLFPRYDWGIYEKNGTKMLLSRGIGWHTIPIRIFNKAEIVHITLTGGNDLGDLR